MTVKHYQEDVDCWCIDNSEPDASDLFNDLMPGYKDKLNRIDKRLVKLLKEIKEVFPDATFYTSGGDGFALVLGCTHGDDRNCSPQQQRVAWNGKFRISGGDW